MEKHDITRNTVPDVPLVALPRTIHMIPMDRLNGFDVRPGFYEINGATAIPGGVNFTVYSHGAASIELLLFRREEETPYAVLPFPERYRIGNVYSMIVFKLNIEEFEYAYRVDGPNDPAKGLTNGIVLTADSGLLLSGSDVEETVIAVGTDSQKSAAAKSEEGNYITRECLLNYHIGPAEQITVKSMTLNGRFVVVKGKHTGSPKGSWKTTLEMRPL